MSSSGEIRLWTIQHKDAWEYAQEKGVLKADGRRIPEYFRKPYRWLIGQMSERIPGYPGCYPIWAYPDKKPDLRQRQYGPGIPGVRIEFVADASNVLVTSLGAWEMVLCGYYCPLTEEEGTAFDAGDEYFSVWRDVDRDPDRAQAIVDSWERIFEEGTVDAYPDSIDGAIHQATLSCVPLDQIVTVTPFTSR